MQMAAGREHVLGLVMAATVAVAALGCTAMQEAGVGLGSADLLTPGQMQRWQVTPGYSDAQAWTLSDGVYEGHGSWVGHEEQYTNLDLQCEFLFDGEQGGIVIRGDRTSMSPWESGYELDIDWAPDREHGHLHFPAYPKPDPGSGPFEPGKWHKVRILAVGDTITVWLDGKKVVHFADDQFSRGQICLEGEEGGVKYRNLRVRRLAY